MKTKQFDEQDLALLSECGYTKRAVADIKYNGRQRPFARLVKRCKETINRLHDMEEEINRNTELIRELTAKLNDKTEKATMMIDQQQISNLFEANNKNVEKIISDQNQHLLNTLNLFKR